MPINRAFYQCLADLSQCPSPGYLDAIDYCLESARSIRAMQVRSQTERTHIPYSLVVVDTEDRLLAANEEALRQMLPDAIGRIIWNVVPDLSNITERRLALRHVIRERHPYRYLDITPGRTSQVTIYPIMNGTGEVYQMIILACDVIHMRRSFYHMPPPEPAGRQLIE